MQTGAKADRATYSRTRRWPLFDAAHHRPAIRRNY